MRLPEYIKLIGDKKAAEVFQVTERAVASWRRGERIPQRKQAMRIVTATHGIVTFNEIYTPETDVA